MTHILRDDLSKCLPKKKLPVIAIDSKQKFKFKSMVTRPLVKNQVLNSLTQSRAAMQSLDKDTQEAPHKLIHECQYLSSRPPNRHYLNSSYQSRRDVVHSQIKTVDCLNGIKVSRQRRNAQDYSHEDLAKLKTALRQKQNMGGLPDMMLHVLDQMVYVQKDSFLPYQQLLTQYLSTSTHTALFNSIGINCLTNRQLITKLLKKINTNHNKFVAQLEEQNKLIAKLELDSNQANIIIESQSKEMKHLKEQLGLEDEHDLIFNRITRLEQQVAHQNEVIKEQQEQLEKQKYEEQSLRDTMARNDERLRSADQEVMGVHKQIQYRENIIKEQKEENSRIREQHAIYVDKVKGLRYFIESLLVKSQGLQHNFDDLQREKHQIQSERKWLVDRAAVGFTNLTPRPDAKQIIQDKQLDFNSIFEGLLPKADKIRRKRKTIQKKQFGQEVSTTRLFSHLADQLVDREQTILKKNKFIEALLKKKSQEDKQNKDEERKVSPPRPRYTLSQRNQKITDQFEVQEQKMAEDINAIEFKAKQQELQEEIKQSKELLDSLHQAQ